MTRQFLEFEQPIEELNQKIEALRMVGSDNEVNLSEEIARLEAKCSELTENIFSRLEPWQIAQMARHPLRPQTTDYIERIFTDFQELHGDRSYSSAPAIIGGMARLNGEPVMVLGHQKGKRTKEKVYRNFGMARPEEYRKALRLMRMAEKFKMPVVTFIDTAGAYPGIGAEERNQSEAIARNLLLCLALKHQLSVLLQEKPVQVVPWRLGSVIRLLCCNSAFIQSFLLRGAPQSFGKTPLKRVKPRVLWELLQTEYSKMNWLIW